MANLFDLLFGCSHRNYTFPQTMKPAQRRRMTSATNTYVVCLECGKEFPYDWKEMRIVADPRAAHGVSAVAEPTESYAMK